MIKMISKRELREMRRSAKSAIRAFAADSLEEFVGTAKPGEVAEVFAFPSPEGCDEARAAERCASALRDEAFYLGHRDCVKVSRRRDRVFLERLEPPAPKAERPRNVWPGDRLKA